MNIKCLIAVLSVPIVLVGCAGTDHKLSRVDEGMPVGVGSAKELNQAQSYASKLSTLISKNENGPFDTKIHGIAAREIKAKKDGDAYEVYLLDPQAIRTSLDPKELTRVFDSKGNNFSVLPKNGQDFFVPTADFKGSYAGDMFAFYIEQTGWGPEANTEVTPIRGTFTADVDISDKKGKVRLNIVADDPHRSLKFALPWKIEDKAFEGASSRSGFQAKVQLFGSQGEEMGGSFSKGDYYEQYKGVLWGKKKP